MGFMGRFTSCGFSEVREARPALGLGRGVQFVQRSRKGSGFLLGEHTGQIFIESSFHLRLGGLQVFCLFGGVQQLAAPVVGGILPGQVALCLQVFRAPRNGGLVRVQQLGRWACVQPGWWRSAWMRSISAVPTPSSRTVSSTSFSASRAIFVIFRCVISIGTSGVFAKDAPTSL